LTSDPTRTISPTTSWPVTSGYGARPYSPLSDWFAS
jgi:hypothetical protein